LGECYPDPASFAARTITNSGRIGSRHGQPFVREAQASCRPTLTPEAQRAVWFPGGLIRIPADGDATGGQLAVAAPSSSGRAQKIDEQRAVDLADDSDYGLVAGIWITNLARAHRVAAQLEAGQIYVNEWQAGLVEGPFGGYKNSDYGREKGMEALHHYTQTKFVAVRQ
jgi:hypothetical protein